MILDSTRIDSLVGNFEPAIKGNDQGRSLDGALIDLVRLLARQAAQEWASQMPGIDKDISND